MKIHVRKRHVLAGKPQSKEYCPINLAMNSKGLTDVVVDVDAVFFRNKGDGYVRRLPSDAIRFIETFDQGGAVAPFSFDLGRL